MSEIDTAHDERVDDEVLALEDRLASFKAQRGAYVIVYKLNEQGKRVNVGRLTADQIDAGEFYRRFLDTHGSGTYLFDARVEGRNGTVEWWTEEYADPASGDDVAAQLEALRANMSQSNTGDSVALMSTMLTGMLGLVTAVITRPPPDTTMQAVEIAKVLRTESSPSADLTQTAAALRELGVLGSGGGADGIVGAVGQGLALFREMREDEKRVLVARARQRARAEAHAAQAAGRNQTQTKLSLTGSQTGSEATADSVESEDLDDVGEAYATPQDENSGTLAEQVALVTHLLAAGGRASQQQPNIYATVIRDALGDAQLGQILTQTEHGQLTDELVEGSGGSLDHAFVAAVEDALRAGFEDDDPDDEPEPEAALQTAA